MKKTKREIPFYRDVARKAKRKLYANRTLIEHIAVRIEKLLKERNENRVQVYPSECPSVGESTKKFRYELYNGRIEELHSLYRLHFIEKVKK